MSIRTEPAGATVLDRTSGRVLGTTPLELELASKERRELSLSLADHESIDVTVSSEAPPPTTRLPSNSIPIGETKAW